MTVKCQARSCLHHSANTTKPSFNLVESEECNLRIIQVGWDAKCTCYVEASQPTPEPELLETEGKEK